jgi:hypothetical protein
MSTVIAVATTNPIVQAVISRQAMSHRGGKENPPFAGGFSQLEWRSKPKSFFSRGLT